MSIIEFNNSFIIAAYSVMWVVVLGYVAVLVRRGGRARSEYDRRVRGNSGDGT